MANSRTEKNIEEIDVAVVGAGVAGSYLCWRLGLDGKRGPVLFEMSDRIGGRLYSVNIPDMEDVKGELGGMRFLQTQRMVCCLADHLGLESIPFPMGGAANFATLRGVRVRNIAFEYPEIVPYRLLPSEQSRTPGDLLVKAIKTVIPCATTLTSEQWELVKQTHTWNGDHLYNYGLWNVLLSTNHSAPGNPPVLSSEAYGLLYDGGGYESLVDNWNCAEAFQYLLVDFPKDAKYMRLKAGFQSLPETLTAKFAKGGGRVEIKHELITFAPTADGACVDLEFCDRTDEKNPVRRLFRAKALVLAMPQRSLEILSARCETLKAGAVQTLIGSVMPMPAYKALLAYAAPWWQSLGVTAGRSTTDLPIRQVYYMDTSDASTNSLMLATYADGRTETFWRPLWTGEKAAEKYPLKPSALKTRRHKLTKRDFEELAPKDFTEMLHGLTAQMHQVSATDIPEPYVAKAKDWTADPFGAGWHFWRPGVKVWDTLPKLRQPIGGIPVHICGEAYTNQQGWVEGALVSAEHVARAHFGIGRPPVWLDPPTYYMGP